MLILNAAAVRAALPMEDAVRAVRWAYEAWSTGLAIVPPRMHLDLPGSADVSIVMPAFVPAQPDGSIPAGLIVKAVSVFPGNPGRGLAAVQGAVLLLDPATGTSVAMMDGGALTAIRTGAGSAVAAELLARRDAATLTIFGTGAQALTQVEGVCAVRPIEAVWIVGRDRDHAAEFLSRLTALPGAPQGIRIAANAREALLQADVVCTATTSSDSLFEDDMIQPGTHINAIGAFRPPTREVPAATVQRARLFVDSRAAALKEAGDVIRAIEEGAIDASHIAGEIGEVCAGRIAGRQSADEVTLFKSVGMAAQDAAAAALALVNAQALGIGRT